MAGKVKISFERITPESAVTGEAEDYGWDDEDGVEFDTPEEVIDFLIDKGVEQGNNTDFYSVDPERDYQDGSETYYGYHLHGFSDEEVERINDLWERCNRLTPQHCRIAGSR